MVSILVIAATYFLLRCLYIEKKGALVIQSTLFTDRVVWPSLQAERCSALTITWLKVTENNNDWDEAEAIIFGGEPTKNSGANSLY